MDKIYEVRVESVIYSNKYKSMKKLLLAKALEVTIDELIDINNNGGNRNDE